MSDLLQQLAAFDTCTAACCHCGAQRRLMVLHPTARGLMCDGCLSGLPVFELEALQDEGERLARELRP